MSTRCDVCVDWGLPCVKCRRADVPKVPEAHFRGVVTGSHDRPIYALSHALGKILTRLKEAGADMESIQITGTLSSLHVTANLKSLNPADVASAASMSDQTIIYEEV